MVVVRIDIAEAEEGKIVVIVVHGMVMGGQWDGGSCGVQGVVIMVHGMVMGVNGMVVAVEYRVLVIMVGGNTNVEAYERLW